MPRLRPLLTPDDKRVRRAYLFRREARNQRQVALHEAAHCVVADHCRVGWAAFIRRREPNLNAWTGGLEYRGVEPTSFPHAVISWAGFIVEFLLGWKLEEWPMVSRKVFEVVNIPKVLNYQYRRKELWEAAIKQEKAGGGGAPFRPSGYGDLEGIIRTRQKWRAMRASWEVVVSRRAEIELLAKTLIQHGKATSKYSWGMYDTGRRRYEKSGYAGTMNANCQNRHTQAHRCSSGPVGLPLMAVV